LSVQDQPLEENLAVVLARGAYKAGIAPVTRSVGTNVVGAVVGTVEGGDVTVGAADGLTVGPTEGGEEIVGENVVGEVDGLLL